MTDIETLAESYVRGLQGQKRAFATPLKATPDNTAMSDTADQAKGPGLTSWTKPTVYLVFDLAKIFRPF